MLHTLLDEQATTCITTRESYLLCHVMKEKPADAKEPAIKFICLAQGEDGTPLLTSTYDCNSHTIQCVEASSRRVGGLEA